MLQKSHWMKRNSQMELYRKPTFCQGPDKRQHKQRRQEQSNKTRAFRLLNYVSNIKKWRKRKRHGKRS